MEFLKLSITHHPNKWVVEFLSKNGHILLYFVLLAAEVFLKGFQNLSVYAQEKVLFNCNSILLLQASNLIVPKSRYVNGSKKHPSVKECECCLVFCFCFGQIIQTLRLLAHF